MPHKYNGIRLEGVCIWYNVFSQFMFAMDRSVNIESKLFVLRKDGGERFGSVEKNRKFTMSLSISRDVLPWFVHAVEEFASSWENRTPYQTNRDGKRVFLSQRCQNHFGRFIRLIELGMGKSNNIIALLEGLNGRGWNDFVKMVNFHKLYTLWFSL